LQFQLHGTPLGEVVDGVDVIPDAQALAHHVHGHGHAGGRAQQRFAALLDLLVDQIAGDALPHQLRGREAAQLADAGVDADDAVVLGHHDAFYRGVDELLHDLHVVMYGLAVDQHRHDAEQQHDEHGAGRRRQHPLQRAARACNGFGAQDELRRLHAGDVHGDERERQQAGREPRRRNALAPLVDGHRRRVETYAEAQRSENERVVPFEKAGLGDGVHAEVLHDAHAGAVDGAADRRGPAPALGGDGEPAPHDAGQADERCNREHRFERAGEIVPVREQCDGIRGPQSEGAAHRCQQKPARTSVCAPAARVPEDRERDEARRTRERHCKQQKATSDNRVNARGGGTT